MDIQQDCVLLSRDGKFAENTSQLSDVVRILASAQAATPQRGLVIHFHGGLVTQTDGRGIADFLAPKYLDVGAYPLFFVWESGFKETLKNNFADILADPAFRELVKKVSEWALKKLGGHVGLKGGPGQTINENQLRKDFDAWFSGTKNEPPVTNDSKLLPAPGVKGAAGLDEDDLSYEIEAGLDGDPDFQDAIQQLHNALGSGTATNKGAGGLAAASVVHMSPRALALMFPGSTKTTKGVISWFAVAQFVAKVVIKVVKRYMKGRAHGMYCTIVEEVLRASYFDKAGATVWNQMKKDTADSFGDNSQCCGTAVASELRALHDAGKTFTKITLVGHSTGAVYICEFLDAMATIAPELKFDIIFLAPAVRYERFALAMAQHRNRIAGFRMFGMSDPLDAADIMVPILYTRSLLYFVSGLLEGHVEGDSWDDDIDAPIVGMQRFITNTDTYKKDEFPEIEKVRQFLQSIPNSTVWSDSSAGNGLNSMSHKHGDFDNDAETVKSIAWIISH